MSLFKIAWRSIQQRGVASTLTAFSMALGVMLVVMVLTLHGVVRESFNNNSNLGYNVIVGAKGGKLQLTLNTVYYLSQPIENIPYTLYLEFRSREDRAREYKSALEVPADADRAGKYYQFSKFAIPLCLGDYYGRFRVVGTTPDLLTLVYDVERNRSFEFAEGRNFEYHNAENGYFEAVVGARVAREMGVKVGDKISPAHGASDGHGHAEQFTVVGVLKGSGTPHDRAVFINMEGFYLMEDHAKPILDEEEDNAAFSGLIEEHKVGGLHSRPLPVEQREVTALLVQSRNQLVAMGMANLINEGKEAQAAYPAQEITALFSFIVQPIQWTLLMLTAMICIVSGVSILVSIYNSMSDRKHEIAVMRALGASRSTVLTVILLESILLSLGGGALGMMFGHGLNWAASPVVEDRTGVTVGFFGTAPPVNLLEVLGSEPIINIMVFPEALLIPALILLAIIVGFCPALSAYRTDVAKSLGA